jgi:hypothetical protein
MDDFMEDYVVQAERSGEWVPLIVTNRSEYADAAYNDLVRQGK